MSKNKYTLTFTEIRATDISLVGGKGANLGEMTHVGFSVPPGFCITTYAFQSFLESYRDLDHLYNLLDTVNISDIETVKFVGQKVRKELLQVPVPEEIINAVRISWQLIGVDHAYAVRSSATAEDLPEASFAGQQETYLNVIGEDPLVEAIRKCWVSLFTDRAILYRSKNNFPHREVKLSVIIQKMILSDVSGTMFSVDPYTGHRHTVSIDASYGLGEALVSGLVTPDAYKIDKRTMKIVSSKIAEKTLAIYPIKEGGTRIEEIVGEKVKTSVLTDAQIKTLTGLAVQLELHYNLPQDIEWAIEEDEIYLLQTRPITSLFPIDGLQSSDGNLHIYLCMGNQQGMTDVMSPLGIATIKLLVPLGHSESIFESTIVRTSGGRIFADVTKPLRHRIFKHAIANGLSQFDSRWPQAAKELSKRPEFKKNPRTHAPFYVYRFVFKLFRRLQHSLWKADLTGYVAQINSMIDDFLNEFSNSVKSQETVLDKLQLTIDTLPRVFPVILKWVPQFVGGMAATRIIASRAQRWITAEEIDSLTLGVEENVVNEMNMAIGDLADLARQSEFVQAAFDDLGSDALQWIAYVATLDGSTSFIQAWEEFITNYGSRCTSEIDIASTRWYEDPMPVLKVIKEFLKRDPAHHRKHQQLLIDQRQAAYENLLEKAGKGPIGRIRKRFYRRQYYTMTLTGGMREHHKFFVIRVFAIIREILKEAAIQLVMQNKLLQPDDIWYLNWQELLSIWDDDTNAWGKVVANRRRETERFSKYTPQFITSSDGETPEIDYEIEDVPEGALIGNPVATGVVEGTVHIIHNPHKESLVLGEILVAEFTDPGWTPLFINAKALVLEVGGKLTHGAVVAREYGIPAVVGVKDATSKLQNGQYIRVDGNRGIIEVIEE